MLGDVLHRLGHVEEAGGGLAQARDLFLALGAIDGTGKVAAKRSLAAVKSRPITSRPVSKAEEGQ
jgi:hypothetical protein